MGEFSKLSSGFTLAEVLVTLGVIGVVAAVTMPTLVSNHQRKVYVTQLKKVYSEFQQAAISQINSRNAINLLEAGVRSDDAMRTFIQSQFNVVKDCTGTPSDCLADSYKNISGGAVTAYADTTASCFALSSGAAICAKYNVSLKYFSSSRPIQAMNLNYIEGLIGDLIIDVNGKKGPNTVGRDLFIAGIYSDGTISSALRSPLLSLNQYLERYPVVGGELVAGRYPITEGELVSPNIKPQVQKSNLEKCQSATSIGRQGDASYCFDEILNNNWEMNY